MLTPSPAFGLALQNSTRFPEMPDAAALIEYGVRAEQLGFESVWAWDHVLLGVEPSFPVHDALLMLTAIAARTQTLRLGTGALILPRRNPVIVAKELATLDHISAGRLIVGTAVGWYKREFDAIGIDFHQRGRLMDEALEIIERLWQESKVDGHYPPSHLRAAVLNPKPVQQPRPPLLIGGHVDAALRRAAIRGDGWLTQFSSLGAFQRSWTRVRAFAAGAGRDPDDLTATNLLPIAVGSRSELDGPMREWLQTEFSYASWIDSTLESAIIGPPADCANQIAAHLAAGASRLVFVPWRYAPDQVERLAREVLPLVAPHAT